MFAPGLGFERVELKPIFRHRSRKSYSPIELARYYQGNSPRLETPFLVRARYLRGDMTPSPSTRLESPLQQCRGDKGNGYEFDHCDHDGGTRAHNTRRRSRRRRRHATTTTTTTTTNTTAAAAAAAAAGGTTHSGNRGASSSSRRRRSSSGGGHSNTTPHTPGSATLDTRLADRQRRERRQRRRRQREQSEDAAAERLASVPVAGRRGVDDDGGGNGSHGDDGGGNGSHGDDGDDDNDDNDNNKSSSSTSTSTSRSGSRSNTPDFGSRIQQRAAEYMRERQRQRELDEDAATVRAVWARAATEPPREEVVVGRAATPWPLPLPLPPLPPQHVPPPLSSSREVPRMVEVHRTRESGRSLGAKFRKALGLKKRGARRNKRTP